MTEDQLSKLWAFARGDTPGLAFEKWFLAQDGLESPLGEDLHWSLTSSNYRDRDEVWKLRKALIARLEPQMDCHCLSLRDLQGVPMGGEGLDERVFATVERIKDHGGDLWWLYLSKCKACGQHWMVAQEERIFDEYFLRRLDPGDAELILSDGRWPGEFLTYERVLKVGRELSQPCVFLEKLSPSLVWTAEDLRKARPDITIEEIAYLTGVTPKRASRLLSAKA
jgi:hypothetical protein